MNRLESERLMRMPYWLLKLLPLFDYLCPCCRKEVPKNSHKCPYCGENYGVPLRVPPKVLKDPKALEEYVHKNIFPKVSASQREYLTQFFTVIFSDGFESGDFSAWTYYEANASVTNELSHHGQYCAKGTVGTEGGQVRKTLDPVLSEVYVRIYCRFPVLPSNGKTNTVIWVGPGAPTGGYSMGPCHSATYGYCWTMNYKSGDWAYFGSLEINKWYCVEVYYKIGTGADAIVKVWIDGVLELDKNDGDRTGSYLEDVRTCLAWTDEVLGSSFIAYVDCVVAADTYIGPEVGPHLYFRRS